MAKKYTADEIHARLKALEDKANVAAYVVLDKDGHHIGTIRFHRPPAADGKLTCSAADWSKNGPTDGDDGNAWTRWQIGWASGTGHDKHSAAMHHMTIGDVKIDGTIGPTWDRQLRDAGYSVVQAV